MKTVCVVIQFNLGLVIAIQLQIKTDFADLIRTVTGKGQVRTVFFQAACMAGQIRFLQALIVILIDEDIVGFRKFPSAARNRCSRSIPSMAICMDLVLFPHVAVIVTVQ
jgi:hypothetical protein